MGILAPADAAFVDHQPHCVNPHIASAAEMGRAIHDTDIGTDQGPSCTGKRRNNL
jgi:hypothetical protein